VKAYLDLMQKVLSRGRVRQEERTGVGTYSLFARQLQVDLSKGFPLLTTKAVNWHAVVHEVLWYLTGATNVEYLHANGIHIWDQWADSSGELGPIYGKQWRAWACFDREGHQGEVDQLAGVIDSIQVTPQSRRHVVSAWNVADLPSMALSPCHLLFQFYVDDVNRLHCQVYQRSADLFIGVPFNLAAYALLTHMVAHVCGLKVGRLTFCYGDVHLYRNHTTQVSTQLQRVPKPPPTLTITETPENRRSIDGFRFEDFVLTGYEPYPAIRAPVAK
jgi:thymidylate synthase